MGHENVGDHVFRPSDDGELRARAVEDVPVNWKELPPPFHSESVRNRAALEELVSVTFGSRLIRAKDRRGEERGHKTTAH